MGWPSGLLQSGVKIRFAHRTFQWSNEGKGNAAVHCIILGFGLRELRRAHQTNDRVVDAAYGYKGDKADKADAPRVAFLFGLYQRLTSLLPAVKPPGRKRFTPAASPPQPRF